MPEIIEGLHVDVAGSELQILLRARLAHHQDRIAFYKKQQESMQQVNTALDEEARGMGKTSSRSPLESIEAAIQNHQNNAVYYKFVGDHINTACTYRLGEGDLLRLGVQSRVY